MGTLAFVFLFAPFRVAAQATVIPDAPTCAKCRITTTDVLRLDARGELPTAPTSVVRDGKGRFWLTFDNEAAMVFGADGKYIKDLKRGEGPGEFQFPWSITAIGDSVLVQDRSRGATLLGPDLATLRIFPPSPTQGRMIPIKWPDSVMLNARRSDVRNDANPFHIASFAPAGMRVARSFGAAAAAPADPRRMMSLNRIIGAAGSGAFWATKYDAYALQRWSYAGQLQMTLVRQPTWFPDAPAVMNFTSPPSPQVRALRQDASGLLWVLVSVAAPTWREGYPKLGPGVSEVGPEAFQYEKLFRTTVEVIDPAAGRVVARQTFDNWIVALLNDGSAVIYDATKGGEPFLRIVRLTMSKS